MLSVWITFRVERLHSWPDAPQDLLHAHLRNPHRHLFHIRVEARVTDPRRSVSFEWLRDTARKSFKNVIPVESHLSCEEMCVLLGNALLAAKDGMAIDLFRIDVSEDGESGAAWMNEFWVPEEQEQVEADAPY